MKITFPHLGDMHIAARLMFKEMGIDVILPEMNSQRILEKGAAISPEEICLPFKIMAGNLMDAYEKGADTVIMPASCGPCRLGEYAELLKSVFMKAGITYEWIVIESPAQIGAREYCRRLLKIVEGRKVTLAKALWALSGAKKLIEKTDRIKAEIFKAAGYAKKPTHCNKILERGLSEVRQTGSMRDAARALSRWRRGVKRIPRSTEKNPVKLLVTGEIYTMIDPFANRNIEARLMEMGVSFKKRVTVSWWIHRTILEAAANILPLTKMRRKGGKEAYLPYDIGGYSRETVEEGQRAKKKGYDGIIQILPVGCMPEIVAKSVLNRISEEQGMCVLNIVYDEMDGEAGYITRLEAFVDMLERRKRKCLTWESM